MASLERKASALAELAAIFLRLGLTAFGGPAAHIALMNHEFVERRGWLTLREFLDYASATNFIPGPNSTELAIHIGYRRCGWLGLIVAGVAFILPAALLVAALASAYLHFGKLPVVEGVLRAVKPVVIAVVCQALWKFGRTAWKTLPLSVIGASALLFNLAGLPELAVLALSGLAALALPSEGWANLRLRTILPFSAALLAAGTSGSPATLGMLFLAFVKIGSVLFGSGYVLLAFLRADLVEHYHWLTQQQLLDAVAVGQVTPGPVFTTATFIGYLLHGPSGALAATIAIFLPAFCFVAITAPILGRLRSSKTATAVLDGVNAGSVALMAAVTWQLGKAAVADVWTGCEAVVALVLLTRFPSLNSAWLMLVAVAVGILLTATIHQ